MKIRNCIALASLLFSGTAVALSPTTLPASDLEAFYHATGGDHWHRNDGWLDPATPICEWYGVSCQQTSPWGYTVLGQIELSSNNLQGEFGPAIANLMLSVRERVDLSGNLITGTIENPLRGPVEIDLSYNLLDGPLPPAGEPATPPGGEEPIALSRLKLAGNHFSGAVPGNWTSLELAWLDLGDNQLEVGAENAFAAMREADGGYLNLAGNDFSGDLSSDILFSTLYETDLPMTGGGLNLCFNDFMISDALVIDWIDQRHVAGPGWEDCLFRGRQTLDTGISGSWFAPGRAGEGISMMLLDDERFLVYSFGFDIEGRQAWSFDVGRAGDTFLSASELLETRGDFSEGLRQDDLGEYLLRQLGSLRLDRVGSETLHAERVFIDYSDCPPLEDRPGEIRPVPLPCPIFPMSDRHDYNQLSRLAGSRCDQTHEYQELSRAWFSPERSGEGFSIEVLANGDAVVYWYTYQPDGSGHQAWMTGQAPAQQLPPTMPVVGGPGPDVQIRITDLLMPINGFYGPSFDPDEIEYVNWGELRLRFHPPDFDTGVIFWDSQVEGYGSGEYPIQRLARPMLASCPD